MKECPKCGTEMELEEADTECGLEGGWACPNDSCLHTEPYDNEHEPDGA